MYTDKKSLYLDTKVFTINLVYKFKTGTTLFVSEHKVINWLMKNLKVTLKNS